MMKVNLCMDSPVEALAQAGFQSISRRLERTRRISIWSVIWADRLRLPGRNVLPFCQSGAWLITLSCLVFHKNHQVVVWRFHCCIGRYFIFPDLTASARKSCKSDGGYHCLACLLYGRAKVLISCLLKGRMIFLLKPCI